MGIAERVCSTGVFYLSWIGGYQGCQPHLSGWWFTAALGDEVFRDLGSETDPKMAPFKCGS